MSCGSGSLSESWLSGQLLSSPASSSGPARSPQGDTLITTIITATALQGIGDYQVVEATQAPVVLRPSSGEDPDLWILPANKRSS